MTKVRLNHIDRSRLTVSGMNMRARGKAPNISAILPSVRTRGILVPLLVRPTEETGNYEIIAGRRRYYAASAVAEETGEDPPLPCAIMDSGDNAAALEASLIENFARLSPDEVTQWETFARLVKEGRNVEDIAATFGITERLVARILALGNLLPRIRTLYRQELIDAATIRHLTMATKTQQKEWLQLYDSPDAYAPTGSRLKEWLCGGETIPTKAALFDLALYTGPIISDLFGDDSYFADPEAFWKLQREAVEAKRQAYLEAGWTGVELIEAAHRFPHWEYEKRGRSRGGRVYILLSQRGEVDILEGLIPRPEASKADRQERGESGTKAERPELMSTLRNYLDLHRHAAVRARLAEHPDIALRLLIAHALTSQGHWNVQADSQRAESPAIAESVETSSGEALFDEKRRAVLALVELDAEAPNAVRTGRRADMMVLFHRLVELSDREVATVAAVVMGETLEAGSDAIDVLGFYLEVDMADLWQADEAFFTLLRDKQVLTILLTEVAGPEAAAANAGATGKIMKSIIRDCLAGENGRTKVERWVPRWLLFPATAYKEAPAKSDAEEPEADTDGTEAAEAEEEIAGEAQAEEAEAEPDAIAAE
ncbi:MAG TPA: ParB N-terminal domain-containing protein [Allosphingosinicella sp.]|nr:ParB N-terminal domain-containing protein [Allosphingosinicella sp.]